MNHDLRPSFQLVFENCMNNCRTQQDRKFSEPGSSPWQEAQEKVSRWNTPPLDKIANPDVYKRPKNGWSTPAGPLSTVGESTGKSSATLDTISVTPTFLTKEKPTSLPKSRPHPEDREADCVSPPPLSVAASSLYHQRFLAYCLHICLLLLLLSIIIFCIGNRRQHNTWPQKFHFDVTLR